MRSKLIMLIGGLVIFFFIGIGIVYNVYTSNLNPQEIVCDYDQFDHVQDYSELDTLPEEFFVVYIHSESGEDSEEVKPDICQFALSNDQDIKVYFSEYPLASMPESVGPPAILVVESGEVTRTYQGVPGIYGFLDDVNSGLYP